MTGKPARRGVVLVALVSAIAGGATALGLGAAVGWVGGGAETVVLERPAAASEDGATPVTAAPIPAERFDPAAIYRTRSPGVVTIYALFAGRGEGAAGQAQGSGFVASRDGYLLTNSHVITTAGEGPAGDAVRPATELWVEFKDGSRVPGSVVGWDLFADVGVVKVDPEAHRLRPLPLGDSSAVAVGEPVAAIGSPFGQVSSLAVGVVSATERAVDSLTSPYSVVDAIQIDAPINRGNSGGPLFNARGQVIGINAQIRSESGTAEGVGFAIPINTARRSMRQLIETGEVRYAWVGVSTQTLTASVARELGLSTRSGAAIQSIVPGSPAEAAGLRGGRDAALVAGVEFRRGGDVIVAIDGRPVRSSEDLGRLVATVLLPGQEARFTIVRDGERLDVPVVLAERPQNPDAGP